MVDFNDLYGRSGFHYKVTGGDLARRVRVNERHDDTKLGMQLPKPPVDGYADKLLNRQV